MRDLDYFQISPTENKFPVPNGGKISNMSNATKHKAKES